MLCHAECLARYNRHAGWDESNPRYPFYTTSNDAGFVEACESLLADKLRTLQWWEEDRGTDGFYVIDPSDAEGAFAFHEGVTTSRGAGKAFIFFHRPDGMVVGLWKNQWSALSPDGGLTWTDVTPEGLPEALVLICPDAVALPLPAAA